jgi:iron-regulated transporter 1
MSWLTGSLLYFQQPFTASAFSLALIYLTVMSFGTVMTGYLAWIGVSEFKLSIFRGFGAVSGVCATLAFPALNRIQGLRRCGLLGIWVQFISLVCSIIPSLLKYVGMDVSMQITSVVLMSGLALSRFGLWLFDLACNQIIQDEAPRELLGKIFGIQQSLQSLFQTVSFAITLLVPDPSVFFLLMAGSTLVVLSAAMLFTISMFSNNLNM